MLTVILALTTSALFGVGDFFGGLASRRDAEAAVTANAHAIGLAVYSLGVMVAPATFSAAAAWAGAAAGVFGGLGVLALYAALARGRMSVVAPITAALSGSLPALWDLARGTSVAPTSLVGLALAIVATIVVSAAPSHESDGHPRTLSPAALGLSVAAGVGFACGFIAFSFAPHDSGFWPLVFARVVSVTLMSLIALVAVRRWLVVRDARGATLGAGLFESAANITMLTAIRIGPLAVASVLGALYPLVTVMLARMVLGERLRWVQRFGIALAIVAVALAAISH